MNPMSKNGSKSISKPEKNLKDAPLPPLPFTSAKTISENETEIEKIANKKGPLTADEAAKLLEDLRHKQEILRKKLDEMYQERGVTPEYIESYLSNPSNFSAEQWKNLQEHRQILFDSLQLKPNLIGEDAKEAFLNPTSQTSQVKQSKERSKKERAARRRGWLPMR